MQKRATFQEVINLITPIRVNGERRYLVRGRLCYFTEPKYAQQAARALLSKQTTRKSQPTKRAQTTNAKQSSQENPVGRIQ